MGKKFMNPNLHTQIIEKEKAKDHAHKKSRAEVMDEYEINETPQKGWNDGCPWMPRS
jgi:hypothetical protein